MQHSSGAPVLVPRAGDCAAPHQHGHATVAVCSPACPAHGAQKSSCADAGAGHQIPEQLWLLTEYQLNKAIAQIIIIAVIEGRL